MSDRVLVIGDTRIRLSNIKDYGIRSDFRLYKRKSIWSSTEKVVKKWFSKNTKVKIKLNKEFTDDHHSTMVKFDEVIEIRDSDGEKFFYTPIRYMDRCMNVYDKIVDSRKTEAEIIFKDEGAKEKWNKMYGKEKGTGGAITYSCRDDEVYFAKKTNDNLE